MKRLNNFFFFIMVAALTACTRTYTPPFNPDASIQYTLTDSLRLSATAYGTGLKYIWHVNDVRYEGQKITLPIAARYYVQMSVVSDKGSVSEYLTITK